MRERLIESSWRALLAPQLALPLSVLLGGVLLHSMNVLITATLLPSIVSDVGGSNLMSWPTTAFVASSIVAATSTGIVSSVVGSRRAFCGGTVIYAPGASQDVLTEVLKETVAIAPTVTKHNGDRIEVLVARDLDFRPVYELRATAREP